MKYVELATTCLTLDAPVFNHRIEVVPETKTASLNQNFNKPTGVKPMQKTREVVTIGDAVDFAITRYNLDKKMKEGLVQIVAKAIAAGVVESPETKAPAYTADPTRKVYADSAVRYLATHG